MLKVQSQFESVVNGKVFRIYCDPDSPLGDAKEFGYQWLKFLGQIEDQNKATQEKAQAEQQAPAPVEEPKPAE